MLTIAEIRYRYPNPVRQPDRASQEGQCYCVGMAVLLAHGLWRLEEVFPGEYDLACGLENLNPALVGQPPRERIDSSDEDEQTLAYEMASAITGLNDEGDFAAAWEAAEYALTWTRPKT